MAAVRLYCGVYAGIVQRGQQKLECVELHRRLTPGERHTAAVEKQCAAAFNLTQHVPHVLLGAALAQMPAVMLQTRHCACAAFCRIRHAVVHRAEGTQRIRRVAVGHDAPVPCHAFGIRAPRAAHIASLQVIDQTVARPVLREIESALENAYDHVVVPFHLIIKIQILFYSFFRKCTIEKRQFFQKNTRNFKNFSAAFDILYKIL